MVVAQVLGGVFAENQGFDAARATSVNLEFAHLLEKPWHIVATLAWAVKTNLGFDPSGRWSRQSSSSADGKLDIDFYERFLWGQAAQFDSRKFIVREDRHYTTWIALGFEDASYIGFAMEGALADDKVNGTCSNTTLRS